MDHRWGYPFKFNRVWLEDEHFNKLIRENWLSYSPNDSPWHSKSFLDHLSCLRLCVKIWQWGMAISNRKALKNINEELQELSISLISNHVSLDMRAHIRDLEKKKQSLIAIEEASWRLKSRAT